MKELSKLSWVLPVMLLLLNCKSLNQVVNQVIEIQSNPADFKLARDKIILVSKIDHQPKMYDLMFDTGATFSAITDTAIISDFANRQFSKSLFTTTDAMGNKVMRKSLSLAVENQLFKSNNLYVNVFQKDSIACRKADYKGIIGADFLSLENRMLSINFDKSQMEVVGADFPKKGFTELETKIVGSHFLVALQIDGKKDYFLLDTGNSGNIIVKNFQPSPNLKFQDREGINFITASTSVASTTVRMYSDVPVSLPGSKKLLMDVISSDKISRNNVGMEFIKNFNWILDWKNKKVYAAPRVSNDNLEKKKIQDYLAYTQQGKLIIVNKNKNATQYALGQQILSVNGTPITSENLCQYQKLLNETENWDTLNLVVR